MRPKLQLPVNPEADETYYKTGVLTPIKHKSAQIMGEEPAQSAIVLEKLNDKQIKPNRLALPSIAFTKGDERPSSAYTVLNAPDVEALKQAGCEIVFEENVSTRKAEKESEELRGKAQIFQGGLV